MVCKLWEMHSVCNLIGIQFLTDNQVCVCQLMNKEQEWFNCKALLKNKNHSFQIVYHVNLCIIGHDKGKRKGNDIILNKTETQTVTTTSTFMHEF